MTAFFQRPCRPYLAFQMVFTVLTLNFFIPSLAYLFTPEQVAGQFAQLNTLLGGAPYTFPEYQSTFWRVLGIANVLTLAFCCALLQWNLQKNYRVLVPLTFMKSTAATLWLVAFIESPAHPAFLAAAILDYVTSGAFVLFAGRAHRAIADLDPATLIPAPRGT